MELKLNKLTPKDVAGMTPEQTAALMAAARLELEKFHEARHLKAGGKRVMRTTKPQPTQPTTDEGSLRPISWEEAEILERQGLGVIVDEDDTVMRTSKPRTTTNRKEEKMSTDPTNVEAHVKRLRQHPDYQNWTDSEVRAAVQRGLRSGPPDPYAKKTDSRKSKRKAGDHTLPDPYSSDPWGTGGEAA